MNGLALVITWLHRPFATRRIVLGKGRSERGEDVGAILEDVPLAKLDGAAGVLDERVSDLVKARRKIQASDNPNKRDLVKEINQEIEASMYQLNRVVHEALAQQR